MAWEAENDPLRQRPGIPERRHPRVGKGSEHSTDLHPTGKPQQNAYIERFNRTVRHEWLGQYEWADLTQVQTFATDWMWQYNHDRPHMALGGLTPNQQLAMTA